MTELFEGLDEATEKQWSLIGHYMEPLKTLYRDVGVTEIMVNRWNDIYFEKDGRMRKTECSFENAEHLSTLIRQLSVVLGQEDNLSTGVLDARFPDQSRACCTTDVVTPAGCTMTLRVAPKQQFSMSDLVENGTMTWELHDFLKDRVKRGDNIIVSGSTGSGKTTMLRGIAEFVNPSERVVTCEDTQELLLDIPNVISMEAPKRKQEEGTPVLALSTLIKTALRQRPDRIIVGEIRDAAAADAFLQAINTGHRGCATSIHANGCFDAIERIKYLIASNGLLDYDLCGRQVLSGVDCMIHVNRGFTGKRIFEVAVIEQGELKPVFKYDANLDVQVPCL
jgi:pilus assembly protein CpaF